MKLATPRSVLATINGTNKTPGATMSAKNPVTAIQTNRSLFGYRTPNPTSTTEKLANTKLTLTLGAKSAIATTTANQKSRLPVSMVNPRSNLTKPTSSTSAKSATPSLVKQRLEFFNKPQTPRVAGALAKTPMSTRLAQDKKAASAANTPFGRLFTPKENQTASTTKPVAQTRFSKTTATTKNPALFSKTPAAKRPLPSSYDKKVSRTVDCANSIKRRSIKFLNAVNKLE